MFIVLVEWFSTIMLMALSIVRSWNLGYQRESYAASVLFQLPLVYNGIRMNDIRSTMMNTFYTVNGLIAIYRWSF